MDFFDLIFPKGVDGYVELSIGGFRPQHRRWIRVSDLPGFSPPPDKEGYFGPALRRAKGEKGKANCIGAWVCWVDLDSPEFDPPSIPPTAVVHSGHGYHVYWRLDRFHEREIEDVNESLASILTGDDAHNIDRLLRLPGTTNLKNDPVPCKLVEIHPQLVYSMDQLKLMGRVDDKIRHKIITGDSRGYRSRSDRDWAIITHLVAVGFSDETIKAIFSVYPCGDKRKERNGEHYLEYTIKKARSKVAPVSESGLIERENCYYVLNGKSLRQLSTFILKPKLLLKNERGDAFVVDVYASETDEVWKDIIFPVKAFSTIHEFLKYLVRAEWVWLGRDKDIKALQLHLLQQMREDGLTSALSVNRLGHVVFNEKRFIVGVNSTIDEAGNVWQANDSPVRYLPSDRERPEIDFANPSLDEELLGKVIELLPRINKPACIWPIIGWFMATPFKPLLEGHGFRFPCLNVFGTKGSGKTTTIQRVFQPLLGYTKPGAWDVNTTNFVILTLLGSTDCNPISFSEFRVLGSTAFIHYVLLAYDSGRDARGRADQTTTQYPLIAPFCLDGEDRLHEPAALERAILVKLDKNIISEGSSHWSVFNELSQLDLHKLSTPYLLYCLRHDVKKEIHTAYKEVREAFPYPIPDRVRKNLAVCWFGVRSFNSFVQQYGYECYPPEGAMVLEASLLNVYNIHLGRAPLAVDTFCEYVVNMAARGADAFPWEMDEGVLWFQLTPAFELYNISMTRQRRDTLSRDSLRDQMYELIGEYIVKPEMRNIKGRDVFAYGINIKVASKCGLDIPTQIRTKTITFTL